MKRCFAILVSLLLAAWPILVQAGAVQACSAESQTAGCGCGGCATSCCAGEETPASAPVSLPATPGTVNDLPMPAQSPVFHFSLPPLAGSTVRFAPPLQAGVALVPLYVRNCAQLI